MTEPLAPITLHGLRQHQSDGDRRRLSPSCTKCRLAWPCDTSIAVAEIERLEAEQSALVADLLAAETRVSELETVLNQQNKPSVWVPASNMVGSAASIAAHCDRCGHSTWFHHVDKGSKALGCELCDCAEYEVGRK